MARAQGFRGFRPKLVSLAVASCFASSAALANPTGAQVANGQVSMLQNGNLLQITNSPNSIINWQSFSIGANEITKFIQQSQASAVLNRVAAGNPSQILGMLQSNGRVFLVNPSGITFGAGSQVDVAGLIATSLNLSNSDFLAGKLKFTDGAGAGSVVNQGNITTGAGGEVYLVGNAVTNNGIITSPNGTVVLAAGNSVELVNPGTPNLRVEITAPDNEAKNIGQIMVDSGRAGIYAGLITNSGTVRADSVVSEGGRILLKATKSATLTDTSVLSAQGKGGGEVKVLAGDQVNVAGKLDASAPNGGDGGFIETSAHSVHIADGTIVTTSAPFGMTGMWLIDPTDFYIGSGPCPSTTCDITGAQLGSNLDSTSVTIISDQGANSGSGDIFVNDAVSWSGNTSLTLTARRDVNVNSPITSSGGGTVALNAGLDGSSDPAAPLLISGTGDIRVNAPISVSTISSGPAAITMNAGAGIAVNSTQITATAAGSSQAASVSLSAGKAIGVTNSTIKAIGGNGDEGGGAATVVLSAGTAVDVNASTIQALGGYGTCCSGGGGSATIQLVGPSGITVRNTSVINAVGGNGGSSPSGFGNGRGGDATITLTSTGGPVSVQSNSVITAEGGNAGSSGGAGGAATVTLAASGNILTDAGTTVSATGGNGGSSSFSNASGGPASVALTSNTGGVTVNGAVAATGGDGRHTSNSGSASASGGNATISLSGTTITVGGTGSLAALGGQGGSAGAFGFEGGNPTATASGGAASVTLSGTGDISVAGNITATGGNGAGGSGAFAEGSGAAQANANGGAANVFVGTSGGITVAGSIQAAGGNAGNAYASGSQAFANAFGGNAFVQLTGGTGLSGKSVVVSGTVGATAGNGGSAFGSGFNFVNAGAGGGSAIVNLKSTTGSGIDAGGITVQGGNGGFAGFTLFGSGSVFGNHTADGGSALVTFNTVGGAVTVNNSVLATGGNGGSGGPRSGGAATIVLAPQVSCDGPCPFPVIPGDVTVNSDVVATGGAGTSGGGGGGAGVIVASNNFTLNGAEVEAYAGANGTANLSIGAQGSVVLNGGNVEASVGCTFPCGGDALVSIAAIGNVDLGSATVTAAGEDSGRVVIVSSGYIHNAGGLITATDTLNSGLNSYIQLTALSGIGAIGAPVRVFDITPGFSASNSVSGDIVLAQTGPNDAVISGFMPLINGNPTGTYDFTSENHNILLSTAFAPGGSALLPGQSVFLRSPVGSITFGSGGSISGASQVELFALNGINLNSGSSVGATGDVLLKSNAMDLQGTVTAGNNIYVTTFSGSAPIDLGNSGAPGGTLALDGGELSRLTALGIGIGSDGTTANTGAMTISGPIGPFSAFPNLFGSSITETTGSINSPGGLNATASGNIALTNSSNNIGAFSAISTGGGVSLVNAGNLGLGAVKASGTVSLTSTGGAIFNLGGAGDGTITAPSVVLAATNGIGQSALPIFVPTATSLSATNSASGDIVLSQVGGNITIGSGGWSLSNAGGDYIIGANTVTLNSGGPSSGDMFVGATTDINVDSSGYTNSGIVSLVALNNVNVNGNLTANDIALFGNNQVNINGAKVTAADSASVLALQLNVTAGSAPAQLKAGTALGVVAGEINVTGGSGADAFAEINVGPAGTMDVFTIASPLTSGNVNLKGGTGSGAFARVFGDPDVGSLLIPFSVGGVVHMDAGTGTGAYARIESAAVNSIHVDFQNVPSGGFFVNGVEGAVSTGDSGFFAGGQPAVPGQNFFVTYSGGTVIPTALPSTVQTAIDQVVALTNQQTTINTTTSNSTTTGDSESDGGGTTGNSDEKQKKQLPICGK